MSEHVNVPLGDGMAAQSPVSAANGNTIGGFVTSKYGSSEAGTQAENLCGSEISAPETRLAIHRLELLSWLDFPVVECALAYAEAGISVFPCHSRGSARKSPIGKVAPHGCLDATRDPSVIKRWWNAYPDALIGGRTGLASGFVVLDVDVKDPKAYGFDTLDELGFAILPTTVMVHTASGGLHLWLDPQGRKICNTTGATGRGIGPGLDWRGEGGYVIVPSPGSGYTFDPCCRFELAPVPIELLPREPETGPNRAKPVDPVVGLSPYAEAALDSACRNIIRAPSGQQEATLNSECYSIGTLVGAGGAPQELARKILLWAAQKIPSYDPQRPWHAWEIETKVNRAFDHGMAHPREASHG